MARTTRTFRALNLALTPTLRTRRDPDRAWDRVVGRTERTGGIAFTDADRPWIEDYRFLVRCMAEQPRLSPIGWQATLQEGADRLANRVRVRELHRRHPEITAEPIDDPVFVVGMPRTATSLAHRLLAGASRCRGPLAWEMTCTDLERDEATTRRRVKACERQFALTKWAPDVGHVHPVHATRPEESLMLLPHGLYHTIVRSPMADYRDWFLGRDAAPDYQYLRAALQVLQHGREKRRWVLKYPLDLERIPTILRVFPGARFVWTHRDPVTVMGSLCSLADLMQSIYLTRPDRHAIGEFTLDLMRRVVEAGREHRRTHLTEVVDIGYYRLASAPERHLPDLYARLGLSWTAADEEHLVEVTERGRVERDRKHEYSLGSYGLASEQVAQAFGDYSRWVADLDV